MYNPTVADVESDNHWLPAVHLNGAEGQQLLTFWNAHKAAGVKATLDGGLKVMGPGDVMAAFSSRGGKGQTLGISKPDVSSIGVQVLAGMTPTPDTITGGPPGELFQAIAGTSMSSPHIAGSAALLKAMHPDWTPGEIKSALMSTAVTKVVKEDGVTPADPFDYGSGREDLSVAGNPGVSVSETSERFTKLENELWNANLPSLYVPVMTGAFVTYRTFQSEAVVQSCWKLTVDAPADMTVKTMPMICLGPKGKPGDRMVIPIAIEARNVPLGEARFATLWAKNGSQTFHMPITIVRRQGPLTVDKTCDPTTLVLGGETACQIKIANTSFDDATYLMKDFLPKGFYIKPGTLDGTPYKAPFFVDAQGKLAGAKPPIVQMRTASYGNGYLPLSSFGVTPVAGVGDDTLVTYNLSRSFIWAGKTYSKIGVSSNGNVVPGSGGSATARNQKFPDPATPNNVLAPFWTDLNLAAGGALRVATLSDGTNRWLVIDWEKAPNFTDGKLNSFQVWIGLNGVEDIAYSYGPDLGSGDPGIGLTVGAENEFGNSGVSWYYNGAGTLPLANSDDLIAFTIPGVPGDTKTITYSMISRLAGKWENCAVVNFNMNLQQLSTACVQGMVTKPSASGPDEISNLIQFIPMVKR
jgi:hypothetical protein